MKLVAKYAILLGATLALVLMAFTYWRIETAETGTTISVFLQEAIV